MSQALKATAILAAMVILQLVWDNFRRLKPDVPLFSAGGWSWLALAALILSAVAIFAIFGYRKFAEDIGEIESWLTLAERELLRFMRDAWDPAGRLANVEERTRWNAMAQTPFIQIFKEGYRTVAHEAFELNRQDMVNRGATLGRASMTAYLLRELYLGSVSRARSRVSSEIQNGNPPFVAPGIREIIGFDNGQLKDEPGFGWLKVTLAVEHGQFPRDIMIVNRTPQGTQVMEGWEVIMQLTRQRPPNWQEPGPTPPISMWRLWLRWLFTIE